MKNKIFHTPDLCWRTNLICAKNCAEKGIYMRRRNLILITVLSLSLTFAAGCGENKNTGAAGSMDQQKTSETTVQNETQVSEDSEQDETEAAATTEAGQDAQSDYQIEMVS